MTHVFHRDLRAELPVAVGGEGAYLIDRAGKRYLDASGGAAVSCLGHGHPAVIAAIKDQLDRLAYAHSSFFTTEPLEELAATLAAKAPAELSYASIVCGGSEAVESALKLARQYHVENGEPERRHVIARWQSFHGNTLGALSAGGNRWRRATFDPLLIPTTHVAPCAPYRDRGADESEEDYGLRVADELEECILRLGPGSVSAFIAETVAGATLGAVPAVPGYFRRVREICDRHGVLLILDEVMCGMGRTGTLFACEQEGVVPDLLTLGKGLGAGYQPIGALLISGRIHERIQRGSGIHQHGHTYMGHAIACAAAVAVLKMLDAQALLPRVRTLGGQLRRALQERFGEHPHVGDLRGRGLFLGLELVADRRSKAPFDPGLRVHARLKAEALSAGLLCYPMGGTVDGRRGDHVLLAPPFILTEGDVEVLVDRLALALDRALQDV